MRKIVSIVLAVLMLFSVMAVSASAEVVCCDNHKAEGNCHCCINCPKLTLGYVTPCAKEYRDGEYVIKDEFCCTACKGVIDNNLKCGCKCDCCVLNDDGTIGLDGTLFGDLWNEWWDEEAQGAFVDGFQGVLARIAAVFDRIFDAIFEFLRLDEILPGARG